MMQSYKLSLLGALPLLVFVPAFVGIQLLLRDATTLWIDQVCLIGSSCFVWWNPLVRRVRRPLLRGLAVVTAFVMCYAFLSLTGLVIMAVVFREGL
jgi:hypothetical protein